MDGGHRAVALVVRWLPFHSLLVLWCFTGYYFVDDTRSHAAWRSSSVLVNIFFLLFLRICGVAVVAVYTYFPGKGWLIGSVVVCLAGCLAGWGAGLLVVAVWLAGWLSGWLAGWLTGWLLG